MCHCSCIPQICYERYYDVQGGNRQWDPHYVYSISNIHTVSTIWLERYHHFTDGDSKWLS